MTRDDGNEVSECLQHGLLHPYVARREASTAHRLVAEQLSDGFGDGEEGLVGADVAEDFGNHDGTCRFTTHDALYA